MRDVKIIDTRWKKLGEDMLSIAENYIHNPEVAEKEKADFIKPFLLKVLPEKVIVESQDKRELSEESKEKILNYLAQKRKEIEGN